jgi:hypothetical protein
VLASFVAQSSETNPEDQGPAVSGEKSDGLGQPTVFEHSVAVAAALYKEAGVPIPETLPKPKFALPDWCGNIVKQLGKTILKPVLKLRPNGKVDWRNFGRLVGIAERYKAFILHDMPRILEQELGDITEEQWKRVEPLFGINEARVHLVKLLNRPVADTETVEDLVDEALMLQLEVFDKMRQNALFLVASQDAKTMALFYKGFAEGFNCFLDEEGNFCGDRGRTNIHLILLACMMEVEKLRRIAPPTTRPRYYDELTPVYRLSPRAYDWFNDVCDDIKFPLNHLGRKRQSPSPIL